MFALVMEACVVPRHAATEAGLPCWPVGEPYFFKSSLLCALYCSQGITAAHCLANYGAGKKKVLLGV